ncbi:MAG: hypothetical protein R3C15_10460 [Thermoleophilia bacterium]
MKIRAGIVTAALGVTSLCALAVLTASEAIVLATACPMLAVTAATGLLAAAAPRRNPSPRPRAMWVAAACASARSGPPAGSPRSRARPMR